MSEQQSSPVETVSLHYIKSSAVKSHAIRCAEQFRPKFTRVGESFLADVQASVESAVRQAFEPKWTAGHHPDLQPEQGEKYNFVTGEMLEKVRVSLNNSIARLIQRKVESHPSIGKTLQGK